LEEECLAKETRIQIEKLSEMSFNDKGENSIGQSNEVDVEIKPIMESKMPKFTDLNLDVNIVFEK
jgi:hypothetical protein